MKIGCFLFLLTLSFHLCAQVYIHGYYRKDGTYIEPHYRSSPDDTKENNYSYPGNYNPNNIAREYDPVSNLFKLYISDGNIASIKEDFEYYYFAPKIGLPAQDIFSEYESGGAQIIVEQGKMLGYRAGDYFETLLTVEDGYIICQSISFSGSPKEIKQLQSDLSTYLRKIGFTYHSHSLDPRGTTYHYNSEIYGTVTFGISHGKLGIIYWYMDIF